MLFTVLDFDVSEANVDLISGILFTWDVQGIEEGNPVSGSVHLRATFTSSSFSASWIQELEALGATNLKQEEVDSQDVRFKPKPFDPIELYNGTFIIPPSDMETSVPIPPGKHITIRPGAAFGTGRHESTQLASKAISKIKGASLLDVGSGSGVLAIVASLCAYSKIVAVEIDEMSRVNAEENFELNGVKIPLYDNISKVNDQFDVVVANIITPVHLELKDELIKGLKPNGHLILSGIVIGEKEIIEQAFKQLTLVEMNQKNEWISFIFLKS
ncbi:50S ribosomal protein L11 methyltransferase [bacterium]|nr:50S ribosomal protein L11 methyltransferase [bacterium]